MIFLTIHLWMFQNTQHAPLSLVSLLKAHQSVLHRVSLSLLLSLSVLRAQTRFTWIRPFMTLRAGVSPKRVRTVGALSERLSLSLLSASPAPPIFSSAVVISSSFATKGTRDPSGASGAVCLLLGLIPLGQEVVELASLSRPRRHSEG